MEKRRGRYGNFCGESDIMWQWYEIGIVGLAAIIVFFSLSWPAIIGIIKILGKKTTEICHEDVPEQ